MSAPKVGMLLEGAAELSRALKLAQPKTQARVAAVIKTKAQQIATAALSRVPRKTGELASTIRAEFSKDGMTGYVKAGFGTLPRRSKAQTIAGKARFARLRANQLQLALANTSRQALSVAALGVYAPVVERGDPRRRHMPHPFVEPSLEAAKPGVIADIDKAINNSMNEVAESVQP